MLERTRDRQERLQRVTVQARLLAAASKASPARLT